MDTAIITTYCLLGVWLQARHHQESSQRKVRDAEIMTALGCSCPLLRRELLWLPKTCSKAPPILEAASAEAASAEAASIGGSTRWIRSSNHSSSGSAECTGRQVTKTFF
ncbi:hypothetical protein GGP66_000153 [Salinibacter ruber]|nr:hypothetical protein [Salinibacter ruber]